MTNIVLRVTPEILSQKADDFSDIIKDIQTRFKRVEELADKTRSYWHGEAGSQDRDSYKSYHDDIQFIISRLEEHPTDLLAMAGIYRKVEEDVAGTNAELQTNQIV